MVLRGKACAAIGEGESNAAVPDTRSRLRTVDRKPEFCHTGVVGVEGHVGPFTRDLPAQRDQSHDTRHSTCCRRNIRTIPTPALRWTNRGVAIFSIYATKECGCGRPTAERSCRSIAIICRANSIISIRDETSGRAALSDCGPRRAVRPRLPAFIHGFYALSAVERPRIGAASQGACPLTRIGPLSRRGHQS